MRAGLEGKREEFFALTASAFSKEVIKKLVFSRPRTSEVLKVSGRLCLHRGKRILALEYSLPGNTVSHKNLNEDALAEELPKLLSEYRQANLITTLGEAEWKSASSGKEALLGSEKLKRRLEGERPDFEKAIEALDNKKSYILSGKERFLIALGVSDSTGRVHDKRQGKFRQINRFLEEIERVYSSLKGEGEILIYDLCCGKSYLSFAVYYYLTEIKKRRVCLIGIDLKRDVINWCDSLARELGYSGMRFIYDDVRKTPRETTPDMVISLHACDVATDIVIDTAAELGAEVILSTPCCHRYLNDKINTEELRFVTKYPHLRNKLCEALTDSVRAARLASYGYDVKISELTDPDDTPKNTLIRAVRAKGISPEKLAERQREYDKILAFLLGDSREKYLSEIK